MTRLSAMTIRIIGAVVALAVVIGLVVYLVSSGPTRSVSADFSSGVGVYNGTPVKILGVQVGSVTKVTPSGQQVRIAMKYDAKFHVPADAIAVVVANSLVSDRYIQLQWKDGDATGRMPKGADIPMNRTASPAELDDIYAALDQLSTALGPQGANKNGALSTLLQISAENLQGNGASFGQSITELSKAAQTLANGRDDLFGTVSNLQKFSAALTQSDTQVRHFEDQLATVSTDLADERSDLGAALKNLTIALHDVANFVKANASAVHTDVVGLSSIIGTLVKEQGALNETLAVAPIALANIVHAYQDTSGTLGTRSNLAGLTDPTLQICGLLNGVSSGGILGILIHSLLGTVPAAIVTACNKLTTVGSKSSSSANLNSILTSGLTSSNGGSN